ncbi:MAG: hypothetical protein AAGF74_06145 [Pseudomonadota bacterium]
MKRTFGLVAASVALSAGVGPASAQDGAMLLASPIPDGAEDRFCYYEGLAYSENAMVIIDVPFRRDSPSSTQKRLLQCVSGESGKGLVWSLTSEERTLGEQGN